MIYGKENKKYHLECQSTADNSMVVRMFEYDSQIALDGSIIEENVLKVRFPNSAVLFLRCNQSTPEKMRIEIETACGSISHNIPIMKVQSYSIEEIFEKRFLFLIPFYIFSHESNFVKYNEEADKLEELKREYEYIKNELERLSINNIISEYTKCTIIDMSNKVLEHIAQKYNKVKEGVKCVMGGKILEYEAKTILKRGIEQGMEKGIEQGIEKGMERGKLQTYIELIKDGIMTLKEAADRLNMKEEELKAEME